MLNINIRRFFCIFFSFLKTQMALRSLLTLVDYFRERRVLWEDESRLANLLSTDHVQLLADPGRNVGTWKLTVKEEQS